MDASANATAASAANGTTAAIPLTFTLPPGLTMDNTYGAALLGTFFALIMYGVLLHQTYNYFRVHWADSSGTKFYVVLILLLDTAHSVVIMSLCYLKLVTHYFSILYLATMDWPLSVCPLCTLVLADRRLTYLSEAFDGTHRCERRGLPKLLRIPSVPKKSRMVVWACMVCQGAGFGLCMAVTVKAFGITLWTAFAKYATWISIALGIAVFVDTILAGVLVFVLHRSRTGVKSTNSLLDTLIAYAVTTGLLTDLFNLLGFVFALVTSQNLYYAAMNMLVTKVYTNSVMAALNFRKPREPVGNYSTMGGSDVRAAHISLSEMSHSRDLAPRSKGSSNTAIPTFSGSGRILDIRVEKGFTSTTDSGSRERVGDLERGNLE
ncbi:hypothetical protein GSI_05516 [Ganoderma sinense ZZ0214-1]|uniref:DUF6534 domain-containing protein n=1 Tax=Ganoderma sinense ZZ0214-1 TaxID=1077348 RepID=A0A2G8SEU6_9APHY|nr:hypothetical protein GSI_05516 [Ganoderma sinense ZZ0214-1]